MKKILKNSMIAMLAVFAVSCNVDDVEDRPVVVGIDAPILTAPEEGNAYVLNSDTPDVLAERFMWSAANFGAGIVPQYDIEIDNAGENFDTPSVIGATAGATQFAASHNVLNAALLALGATPEVSANFEVRVKAYVGSQVLYSDAVEMIITPYEGFVPLQHLYVVGTATEFGFENNAGNTPMFRDASNQSLFHLRAYFNNGQLKLLGSIGSWQPQYGTNDGTTLAGSADGDPGEIIVATAGYYDLTVNLEEMTFSLVAFDATAAPSYTTMGIIGNSTPGSWDTDTDMTNSTLNPHIWKVTQIVLTPEEAKFRTNDDWAENWGGGPATQGIAQFNSSGNIPVAEAGSYNVWFNDLDQRYIFIKQ